MGTRSHSGKQLVVLSKTHLHSHSHVRHIPQRLLLEERMLAEQIRDLRRERAKVRQRIREALDHGAKCEHGLRSAKVVTRHVLEVR